MNYFLHKITTLIMLFLFILTPFQSNFSFFNVNRLTNKAASLVNTIKKLRSSTHVSCHALFPPDDAIEPVLKALIDAELSSCNGKIDLTAFQFSSPEIFTVLLDASRRCTTNIRIVADTSALGSRFNYIRDLHEQGLPVYIYPATGPSKKYTIMHNKFIIFYSLSCIWTGSMNFTRAGMNSNQENVLIIQNPNIVAAYAKQFEKLIQRSTKL